MTETYRCPECRDTSYVAGEPVHRFGIEYPTRKPCPRCACGPGSIGRRWELEMEAKQRLRLRVGERLPDDELERIAKKLREERGQHEKAGESGSGDADW